MIKICDAIMGSGKSSAAITFMNENPEQKFIYITPYLEEADRIIKACPELNFAKPGGGKYEKCKVLHTQKLVEDNRNIASTHQALKGYTEELLSLVRDKEYVLIVDESIDSFDCKKFDPYDVEILEKTGFIKLNEDDVYERTELEYKGGNTLTKALLKEFDKNNVSKGYELFYTQLSIELLTAFKDVYIMTYLFEGNDLYCYFKMNKMEFEYIGVVFENGKYSFSEEYTMVPDYVSDIRNKIHILDNEKMNWIRGDRCKSIVRKKNDTELSQHWMASDSGGVKQLKRNLHNYFGNIMKGTPPEQRLWGTYCGSEKVLKGKGYASSFLVFNARATNKYRNCTALAYCVNLYMNASLQNYFKKNGVEVDQDLYALSTMVQWIWRSAIRDGNEITLYLPSIRMRTLLTEWMDGLSGGVKPIVKNLEVSA